MSRKKSFNNVPNTDVRGDVIELEKYMESQLTSIWSDDVENNYFRNILGLELSDRRLWLTFVVMDYSIIKVARLFSCDRKTVSGAINNIKEKLGVV